MLAVLYNAAFLNCLLGNFICSFSRKCFICNLNIYILGCSTLRVMLSLSLVKLVQYVTDLTRNQ